MLDGLGHPSKLGHGIILQKVLNLFSELSVQGTVRSHHIITIRLRVVLVLGFGEGKHLFLTCIFGRGEEILLMVRVFLKMFYFLLAV